ncbi:MAG: FHA domain-containing protein [Lysobacteraceae bacterium]
MRLSFPNGEHPDVLLEQGEVTIGSAPGNRILIPDVGLAARHASLRVDAQRGIVLHLEQNADIAHVNARPVREAALLRLGDVVSFDRLRMLVKPDDDALIQVKVPADSQPLVEPAQRTAAARVVLRGVSGDYSGRSLTLQDPVRVGSAENMDIRLDDAPLPAHWATLELHGERVLLRDQQSADGCVVNGVAVHDAVLHPGDQIAFDDHRFVVEAPGLPLRGAEANSTPGMGAGSTQTLQAVRQQDATAQAARTARAESDQDDDRQDGGFSYGWLILVAAAIGAGLAALLVYAPR